MRTAFAWSCYMALAVVNGLAFNMDDWQFWLAYAGAAGLVYMALVSA